VTTYVVDTAGGGDYTTLAAAEAALNADIRASGTNDTNFIIDCQGGADTTGVTIVGWSTDSTHRITIRGSAEADGKNNGNTFSASYYHLHNTNSGSGASVIVQEEYVTFDGIQFLMAPTGGSNDAIRFGSSGGGIGTPNDIIVKNCRFRSTSTQVVRFLRSEDTSLILTVYNSTFEGAGSNNSAYSASDVPDALHFVNCVFEGLNSGLATGSADPADAVNCLFINNVTDVGVNIDLTYCAGDSAEFDTGTGNIGLNDSSTDWNAAVEDYTIGDYRPKVGSVLIDVGDATSALTTDINGNAWSIVDIGAFAYDSGGGGSSVVILRRRIEGY